MSYFNFEHFVNNTNSLTAFWLFLFGLFSLSLVTSFSLFIDAHFDVSQAMWSAKQLKLSKMKSERTKFIFLFIITFTCLLSSSTFAFENGKFSFLLTLIYQFVAINHFKQWPKVSSLTSNMSISNYMLILLLLLTNGHHQTLKAYLASFHWFFWHCPHLTVWGLHHVHFTDHSFLL